MDNICLLNILLVPGREREENEEERVGEKGEEGEEGEEEVGQKKEEGEEELLYFVLLSHSLSHYITAC